MKKLIFTTILMLIVSVSGYSQSVFPEFDKAREIKLLESKRKDVTRLLAGFEHDKDDDEDYEQTFSNENVEIEVTFARGDCSDNSEYWDVAEWVVTKVVIEPNDDIKVEDFNYDFSTFRKETEDEESPENYKYYNESLGIAFKVKDNEINKIYLFPPITQIHSLCNNVDLKEYASGEEKYVEVMTRFIPVCTDSPPTVDDVILDKTTIIIGCDSSTDSCSDSDKNISVTTVATDKENDPLTYQYQISVGKIIGVGAKVVWDLTGVAPGSYTITVGANDGSGIQSTKTQTVVIEKCADCSPK